MAVRRGLRSCHGLGRKPYQLDRKSGLGGGTEGAPGVVVELDMSCRVRWKARFLTGQKVSARVRKIIQHPIENA